MTAGKGRSQAKRLLIGRPVAGAGPDSAPWSRSGGGLPPPPPCASAPLPHGHGPPRPHGHGCPPLGVPHGPSPLPANPGWEMAVPEPSVGAGPGAGDGVGGRGGGEAAAPREMAAEKYFSTEQPWGSGGGGTHCPRPDRGP